MRALQHCSLAIALCAVIGLAEGAASSQAGGTPQFKTEQIADFAKQLERTLAQKHAYVAIVARKGRPDQELPPGFDYTHIGVAVYSQIELKDGRRVPGYAIHSLYQQPDNLRRSYLATDFPIDFFSSVYELKAGVLIPTPPLQQRLLQVMHSDIPKKLHVAKYSVIANPYTLAYQNCTEHTLDIINAAVYQTDDVRVLKANARAYFKGQAVRINPFKLLLGNLFMVDVATSDHGEEPIVTATFETLADYLQENALLGERLTIQPVGP